MLYAACGASQTHRQHDKAPRPVSSLQAASLTPLRKVNLEVFKIPLVHQIAVSDYHDTEQQINSLTSTSNDIVSSI